VAYSLSTCGATTLRSLTALPGISLDRSLLTAGALAGPVYVGVGLAQALLRPGFDITRHDLSLLANGDLGWIQIGNFLISGLLVIAGAMGLRRTLQTGQGRIWGPLLLSGYGLGLIGAGVFAADPAFGFPPGTPADANSISWPGLLHILTAALGFAALIGSCGVFARRFATQHERAWATYSSITGAVFLFGFIGVASGSGATWSVFGFWVAVVLAWSWITAISLRYWSAVAGR
jgi:Protein of unknown function (DUF998)